MGKDLKGKELGKGISQRPNGKYMARYYDRFGKRKTLYNQKLSELKRELARAIHENNIQANVLSDKIKLDEWFDKWISIYKENEIRESSKTTYTNIYKNHISPTLGQISLSNITHLHIKNLINYLKIEKGHGYEMLNKARIILYDMFNKAILNEYLIKNPAFGIKIVKDEKKDVQVLSKEDQYTFMNCAAGTFYYNMFEVHILSGLRPGELYALRECDLDFENETISVNRTLSYQKFLGDTGKTFHFGPPKTEQSKRIVPMSDKCKFALQRQILQKRIIMKKTPKQIPEEFQDLLFTTKYGTPINTMIYKGAINKIIDEINLTRLPVEEIEKISPHCFRHTFATRCFEAGIDFKVIQKYLGHASMKMTTDLYVHVTDTMAGTELPKLDEYYNIIDNMDNDIYLKRKLYLDNEDNKIIDFNQYAG